MKQSSRQWSLRMALMGVTALLVLAQVLAVVTFLQNGWSAITFPYPLDYGDGPILDQVIHLSQGQNIYRHELALPPYTIANYPPLFMLLQTPFARLFGPAYWYGRTLALLGVLMAAVCIGLTVQALTASRSAALAAGTTLLAVPYVFFWAPQDRVDGLALGLSWAGLFVLVRWSAARWGLITAALLLAAAVYTRQSYGLAAPLAALVLLLHQRPRARAALFAALFGGVCVDLFVVLNILTGGGFFFNIVVANVNPFQLKIVGDRAREMWASMSYLLLGSGVLLLAGVWRRDHMWWLVAPYLVGALLSAATVGKVGSNVNYLLELAAALSLAAGGVLGWSLQRRVVYTMVLLILAVQIALLIRWSQTLYAPFVTERVAQRAEIDRLSALVHQTKGVVLADEYMGLLPLDGRPLYFQPFEMTQLAKAGLWDQTSFLQTLDAHQAALVLLYQPQGTLALLDIRWTPQALDRIHQRYKQVGVLAQTVIYQPK